MPQYSSYGMSPIRRRTPIGMNVAAFADAVGKLDAKYQAMAQQQSAIDMALAQLPVNAAEDEWKYNLGNEIRSQIESVDNPNDRYLTSIRAAGQLMSRPDVVGRIRAEAEYQNFVKQTQARNDIDQRTKNWALATNQYSYQDVKDKDGNIVGGSQWKPNNTPVGQVDLSKLGSLALQWAKPDEAKGSKAMFVNSKGEFTEDLSDAVDVAYQTIEGYKTLGKDKLIQAINAAIDMTPGARASIEQDYNVASWEYNKLTPEQKANIGESEITDGNGRTLTKEEFLAKKINPWVNAASYSNKESTINHGTGLQNRMALKQQAAANALAAEDYINGIHYTGTGYNITYDTSDYLATAQGTVDDAIRNIENIIPNLVNTKMWKEAKATGNYSALEGILKGSVLYRNLNPENKNNIDAAFRNITNEVSFLSDVYKDLDKDTKDALLFKSAVDAGQRLPDDNTYSKTFYGLLNKISDNKPAEKYKFTFNDKSDVDDFLNRLNMNEATAKQNGLEFGYDDGFRTITIKENSNVLPKAVINFMDGNDDFFSLPWNRSRVTALDGNNNDIGSTKRGTLLDNFGERLVGSWTTANHINNLNSIVSQKVNRFNASGSGERTTDQLKIADIPAVVDAQRKYGIESAEFGRAKKEYNDALAKKLSSSDWTQFQVYNYNEDTRGLTIMPNKNRGEEMSNIIGHIQNGKADVQLATNGIQHGYYVTLHEKLDKNGNVDPNSEPKTYFISSGIQDEALEEFKSDSNTRATAEYNRRRSVVGNYRTYLGQNITNIGNNGALVDGKPVDSNTAIMFIETDKVIDDVVNGIKTGKIPITNEDELTNVITQATQHIAKLIGISNTDEAIKIANIIYNKIK